MTAKKKSCRIFISRTEREWKAINLRLKKIGRSDLHAYIIGRLSLIQKQYNADPGVVCKAIEKRVPERHYIPEQYAKILEVISLRTEIPISTIVDRLIIDPLINPLD